MDFVVGDVVRQGFGFANPNHAAAAICVAFPFCWGWRDVWRWSGRLVGVALCVMLAMTYSRTGMLLMAIEAIALSEFKVESVKCKVGRGVAPRLGHFTFYTLHFTLVSLAIWWMWPRMALDGAILNRPKIWLAGLKLFAANPLGVGFGNSGEIATAFVLPDGITVRTLVNSHLTLLAEMGALGGGAWLAFIALTLCVGRKLRRTWVAFAGLALSAFSVSVFDWHVLFDFKEMGGFGLVNFVLAWGLFVAFVGMGVAMVTCGVGVLITQRRVTAPLLGHPLRGRPTAGGYAQAGLAIRSEPSRAERVPRGAECAESSWKMVAWRTVFAVVGVAVGICAVVLGFRSDATPRVERGYVAVGNGGPCVYRDEGWGLKSVAKRFPDGARFCIRPGVLDDVVDAGEVWLFGDAAESAWRFPAARLTLVSPPEFFDPPTNAVVVAECSFRQD